jgi:hypothetical protein
MKKSDFIKLVTEILSGKLNEEFNPADKITLDVPLFIRLLEYAREDAKTDMDLHNVTEKVISLSTEDKILTMSDYNNIVTANKENMNEIYTSRLEKIANEIRAKFPNQGSYDPGELFDEYKGEYNLTPEEERLVYMFIRDKENAELAESTLGEKKLTPAEMKKREEIVKSMKSTFKGPKAAMYAIATDKAKKVAEDLDIGHQDDEPDMLKADVARIAEYANALYQMLDKFDKMPGEVDFPDWWQQKIHIAAENMDKAKHYLEFEMKQPAMDNISSINIDALTEVIITRLKSKKK